MAIGGINKLQNLNTVELFNPLKKKWTAGKPMKQCRSDFGATVLALSDTSCFFENEQIKSQLTSTSFEKK